MLIINELYLWAFRVAVLLITVFSWKAYLNGKRRLLTLLIGLLLLAGGTTADVILLEVLMQRRFDNPLLLEFSNATKVICIVSYIVITFGVKKALLERD